MVKYLKKTILKKLELVLNQCQNQENTIDPENIISNYGADAARLFILSDSHLKRCTMVR